MHHLAILHYILTGRLTHPLFCSMEKQDTSAPEVTVFHSGLANSSHLQHVCSITHELWNSHLNGALTCLLSFEKGSSTGPRRKERYEKGKKRWRVKERKERKAKGEKTGKLLGGVASRLQRI